MPVYLLHYPEGIEVMKASGIIQNISENNYNMRHLCDSDFGSSGVPLINLKNFKVLGIHKGAPNNERRNWNLGTLLNEPIKKLKEEIEIINNQNNDIRNNDELNDNNKIRNNILYYNENNNDLKNIYEDSDYFESKNLGAFILCTNIESLELIKEEIIRENEKDKNIIFNLILGECDLNKFQLFLNKNKGFEKCIQNTLIYNKNKVNYPIDNIKALKIIDTFNNREDVNRIIDILSSKDIKPFPLPKLIKYEDYLNKYKVFHVKISQYYGDLSPETFKKYFQELKLIIEQEEKENKNIKDKKTLINGCLSFEIKEDLNAVDKLVIQEWTKETIYADFNKWLYNLNILNFEVPAYFASRFMYSLNSYGKNHNAYFNLNNQLVYRGVKKNYSSLILYKRAQGKIIVLPSFISSCKEEIIANIFAGMESSKNGYKMDLKFSTVFIIQNCSENNNYVSSGINIQRESTKTENEILFLPFSFYYVGDIKIDTQNYTATIYLILIGKNEILEEQIKKGKEIEYNEKEKIIQIKNDFLNNKNI